LARVSSEPATKNDPPLDSAAAQRLDKDAEFDRRLDEIRADIVRTFRIWLTLSQLVVIETVALLVLVARLTGRPR
jgi:hypothetical protein